MSADRPLLFQPMDLQSVTVPNRLVVSPMAQYCAVDGVVGDWHLAHLGSYAKGGWGLVFAEFTAVTETGRISNGDPGIYNAEQIKGWARVTDFIKQYGAVPAIQLAHCGRKGSAQRAWEGNGPLTAENLANGDKSWPVMAPSALKFSDGWVEPKAMDQDDINTLVQAFADAAKRSLDAGFEAIEIHGAHGYLIQSFLSPLANQRNDAYGGDREGRMRFPLEVTEAIRAVWPKDKPLFFRVSSVDGIEGGWEIEDSFALAAELKQRGVDVIDCSSGGNNAKGATNANLKRLPGYQVPFAEQIRREVDIKTMAVGLIREPDQADQILQDGKADLIAIGREAMYNPFWAQHAAQHFRADDDYDMWPSQYGWWLKQWSKGIRAREAEETAAGKAAE